ncbi:MAG: ligand-binding sensor domain-containing protein/FixJ family two-component response regulator [Paraglaciecola sp.]|jgi:ligand-binding sensor domain-containing protein/FixJ family two-component response regulator
MLCKIFCWSLLFLTQVCFGQESSMPLFFDHLTINDGLSHNTIYDILQDDYGYIWIGTQNGLNKYDGYSFEVYGSNELENDKSGFIGMHISSLFEDKKGNLWVGTRRKGINFKAKSSDRFINFQSDSAFIAIKGFDVSSFFEDKAGNIWITTVGAGVLKYNPETNFSKIYNQANSNLSSELVFDIIEDKYDNIWVATAGGGLNYLNGGQFELSHDMLPNYPNMAGYRKKLLLDDEYIWIATEGTGLYQMNIKDRSYVHFSPENQDKTISSNVVKDIYKAKDGKLFIATDGKGLNIYDTVTEKISYYDYHTDEKTSLNSNSLICLWGDRTDNVWLGTYNGGLNIYKPNKIWFEFFAPSLVSNNELQYRSILSIFQRHNEHILVGTDGGGLQRFNQNKNQFEEDFFKNNPNQPNSIAGNVVKTIFEDSQNRLWIGMFGAGLDLYDPITKAFQHIIDWRPNVWSIAERKDGKLLIGSMGQGICIVNPETLVVTPFQSKTTNPNNLGDPNIMTIFVDNENKIWIGSAENGLDVLDANNKHLAYFKNNPLDSLSISDDAIRRIFQDSGGDIWIGTERGGLNRWLGNGKFERITQEDGLISNSVMGITEDSAGFIWISTFQGISQFDKTTKSFRNFDFHATQNANQFNQSAILADDNGRLFFGGIYGLNTIQSQKIRKNKQQAEIIFTDIKIFNKSVPIGKSLDGGVILEKPIEKSSDIWLSYLDQSFSIDFTAIDYTNPLENEFTYKMEGFNEEWQQTSAGQHSVSYTNLDPGKYIFKIKYKEKLATIKVNIKPPYWQTLWFRALVAIFSLGVVSGGLFFLIKRRETVHKQKILQLENEKLATEMEVNNSKLMYSSIQMAHKNEVLTEVKKGLIDLEKKPEPNFKSLVRRVNQELENQDYWSEFNLYFNQVDQNFIDKIIKRHPALTKNDLRMCSLLRLNLDTKEIASLLNTSVRAVEQSRYRLKKRLAIPQERDLLKYITSFTGKT